MITLFANITGSNNETYELTGAYKELQSLEEDQAVIDTLEGIGGEISMKAEGIAMVLANSDGDIAVIDEEIKRLTAKKKIIANRLTPRSCSWKAAADN